MVCQIFPFCSNHKKSPAVPNYSKLQGFGWDRAESNRRHRDFQSRALPTELQSLKLDVRVRKYKSFSSLCKVLTPAMKSGHPEA